MTITSSSRRQIAAEAVEWFLRFQGGARHPKDDHEFSEWLTRSAAHVEEYLAVSVAWTGMSAPDAGEFDTDALIAAARGAASDDQSKIHRLTTRASADQSVRHTSGNDVRRRHSIAIAATIVMSCGLWLGFGKSLLAQKFVTAVGEQRSITLTDGSVVILNTDSAVVLRWTAAARQIDLIKGEGLFHVAKNPARPFLVSTPDATVRAVGTVFNVRHASTGTQVAVLEGSVKVSAAAAIAPSDTLRANATNSRDPTRTDAALQCVDLTAGHRLAVTARGIEPEVGPTVESIAAWTERRLVFRDQRLADVVQEFNRYRLEPLVVDDSALAGLKISGVFSLSDPESLVGYLKSFEGVDVQRRGGRIHLSRSVANAVAGSAAGNESLK